ncbi:MAG: hypothetical protein WAP74_01830 [Patescibacteria group bacterium]
MAREILIAGTDHLETIRRCDGYYEATQNGDGTFLGPLVITGSYEVSLGTGIRRALLSPILYNIARVEQKVSVLSHFSRLLRARVIEQLGTRDIPGDEVIESLIVIPRTNFGTLLAFHLGCQLVEAEKRITRPAGELQPPQYELVFERHRLEKGQRVAIFDDVGNNFTGVTKLITELGRLNSKIVAVICVVNRSGKTIQSLPCHGDIPIISLLDLPTPQYHQDDPLVAAALEQRNIFGDPKKHWDQLLAIMKRLNNPH